MENKIIMLTRLYNWLTKPRMSEVENYLAKSTDLADLERRQKELQRSSYQIKYWV